jgi:hypothetical protein
MLKRPVCEDPIAEILIQLYSSYGLRLKGSILLVVFTSPLTPLQPEPLLIVVGYSRLERGVI